MSLPLVPNRECGACNVCCSIHPILDPALEKAPGVLCPHWQNDCGCSIYQTRPDTCRGHHCAWRHLDQYDESWRPDRSNIYIELKDDPPEHFRHVLPDAPYGFRFTVLGDVDQTRLGMLATTTASLIANDIPVILAFAPPPGFIGSHIFLNPPLKPYAASFGQPFLEGFVKALHAVMTAQPEPFVFPATPKTS